MGPGPTCTSTGGEREDDVQEEETQDKERDGLPFWGAVPLCCTLLLEIFPHFMYDAPTVEKHISLVAGEIPRTRLISKCPREALRIIGEHLFRASKSSVFRLQR